MADSLDDIKSNTQVILFLLGPHWIKTPPLSLVYLENFLSQKGYTVKIIDLNIIFYHLLKLPPKDWLCLNSDLENNLLALVKDKSPGLINNLISQIAKSRAKILGFSLYSRNCKATFNFVKEVIKQTKDKTFIFGGPQVLFEYYRDSFFEEINPGNSYFVLGEGELPLLNICQNIYENRDIGFQVHKGKKLIAYEEINDLNKLPFLNFEGVNLKLYDSKIIPLFSSRGCIKRCAFCSECKLSKTFRQHSPEYMINLIKSLIEKHRIFNFSFHDSLINANLNWLDKFCSLIIKNNLNINWEAQISVRNDISLDLLKSMKLSGCYNLFVGLESASSRILKLMHKGYNKQEARDFLRNLYDAGLQFEVSLITGFPEETDKDFNQTLLFIKDNKGFIPKIAQVNPFVGYPPAQINKTDLASNTVAKQRVNMFIKMFERENIKYTRSFINNLVEQ
jgi:radical SAM superfamily enzyme YgiQ (UPF0313 family)